MHRPHKLIKNIEIRKQRQIDDIQFYANVLEKNYDILKKMDRTFEPVVIKKKLSLTPLKKIKNKQIIKKSLKKREKINLLKKVGELGKDISNLSIPIKINYGEDKNAKEYSYDKNKKLKNNISYLDTLDSKIFPWFLVKISNFTPAEAFNEYKQLVPDELSYNKLILKKSVSVKSKLTNKKGLSKQTTTILPCLSVIYSNNDSHKFEIYKPEEGLFCYCKMPFLEGDFMVGK